MDAINFGILTVSDSCSAGSSIDRSGPSLCKAVRDNITNSRILHKDIVPDNMRTISGRLILWSKECDIILTTGGTGLSPRDVTPEATKAVINREVPGIAYAIISKSLQITPMAMLSRLVCGIRDKTLIINFPGSAKAAVECFEFVKDVLPHAIDLILNKKVSVTETHQTVQATNESKVKIDPASRNRASVYEIIEQSEACKILEREIFETSLTEEIPLEESLTRVLAEDIVASEPIPSFPASIKDGYAVLAEDGCSERTVLDFAAAGDQPGGIILNRGEAIRISTGAPVPGNANAVIQVEDTELLRISKDGKEEAIRIKADVVKGQDIREIGSEIKPGEVVLRKRDQVTAFHAGVLAMLGRTTVNVFKRPTIGIISSGNELRPPGETLRPGQIWDSNKVTLMQLLKSYGYDSCDRGIARDDPNCVKRVLEEAFAKCDVVVSSGGVSMGEFDLFKQVLVEDFDATIHFGRVNIKPGKPTVFATLDYGNRRKMVFGLPGNPASCSVTCLLFVIPSLWRIERRYSTEYSMICLHRNSVVGVNFGKRDVRPEFVRVKIASDKKTGQVTATSTGNQISSRLNSMVGANGLLCLPGKHSRDDDYFQVCLFDTLEA